MGRLIDEDILIDSILDLSAFEQEDFGTPDMIRLIEDAPTVQAIPKADYETRLKADIVAMFEDLSREINPIKECEQQIYGKEQWNFVGKCQDLIQQKIDKLKENKGGLDLQERGR